MRLRLYHWNNLEEQGLVHCRLYENIQNLGHHNKTKDHVHTYEIYSMRSVVPETGIKGRDK